MSQSKESFNDYEGFVAKFKPKKTTDDCYTPPGIYDVVAGYVTERFGIDRADMVRPFWPGGDYEGFDYPAGCCVVDNPPFSILSRIKRFYLERGIPFFLFAPSLTSLSPPMSIEVTSIFCGTTITYENGAVVQTAFVTNMAGDIVAESEPELGARLNAKMEEIKGQKTRKLPRYEYPVEVLTAARLQWLANRRVPFRVRRADCMLIDKLDEQVGKKIFGGGLLLSERATAERAAADRAAADRPAAEPRVWKLSERERRLVRSIG